MFDCSFTIMVGGRGYHVSCSHEGAKKLYKEQELYDCTVIWHSRKPGWLAEATPVRKAA